MANADLTAQRLRELVHYDPATGAMTRHSTGATLATKMPQGHLRGSVDGVEYLLHRLAWLYMTGEWPSGEIDHIDGDGSNNRWANLRDTTKRTNQQNRRRANKNSKSGLLGASWRKDRGHWTARILVGKRYMYLGRFETAEEAHAAYVEAKRIHHAGCTL